MPIVEATSCQKKQLRHSSMLVSTRHVMLSTILRLSTIPLKNDFADNLRALIGTDTYMCCAMVHVMFKGSLTCSMLHVKP